MGILHYLKKGAVVILVICAAISFLLLFGRMGYADNYHTEVSSDIWIFLGIFAVSSFLAYQLGGDGD